MNNIATAKQKHKINNFHGKTPFNCEGSKKVRIRILRFSGIAFWTPNAG